MKKEFIPFHGIDGALFGQTRDAVRQSLGAGFTSFKKTSFSETETDSYNKLGLHLYYDKSDKLELIEAFPPAQIVFKGIPLIDREIDAVVNELVNEDFTPRFEEPSYFFDNFGFALVAGDEKTEGVSLFCKGYYD